VKAFIKGISYYLPSIILRNEDLVKEFPEWSISKISEKIGVSQRHISEPDETAGDMAEKSARILFLEYGIQPSIVDFILLCTQSPDYFLPTTACLLQDRLGISKTAGALDFNLGCSGFVYGLSLAKGLIFGGIAKNILLLTSETYSKHIHQQDKGNRSIFGDAAAATLISTEGFAEIGNFCLGTDGSGEENLIIKTGGFRNKERKQDLVFKEGNPISSDFLYMNGSEILNFTLEAVPLLVKDTLVKNGIEKEDIDLFVLHQANKFILDFLRKKLAIEEDKFYYFLDKVGNTVSSTIPIALKEAQKENKLEGNILLAGFGVGYSWAATILKSNRE
jgi:3-oxoacyl-[acyl-carrier-protein] synthase III